MAVLSSSFWTLGLLIAFILATSFPGDITCVEAETATSEGDSRVKCKQHIEEALRQYWDHEKGAYVQVKHGEAIPSDAKLIPSNDEADSSEEMNDESNSEPKKPTLEEEDDDEDSGENESQEQPANDTGRVSQLADDDDDSDEDDSGENDSVEVEKQNVTQSVDDDDDDDDDSQESSQDKSVEDNNADSAENELHQQAKKESFEEPEVVSVAPPEVKSKDTRTTENSIKEKVEASKQEAVTESNENEDSNESDEDDDVDDDDEEEYGPFRSRAQIEDILKLYDIGTKEDKTELGLIHSIFRDLKKIYDSSIKPMEKLYKYRDFTNRIITDTEIFSKPMVMVIGAKSSGKTSLVNYLLGLDQTPLELKTGLSVTSPHFTIIEHGDAYTQLSPVEIAADGAFSNLQQFGQHFVKEHLQAYRMPLDILQRITVVDSPGLIEGILNKSPEPGKGIDNEVYQWFVDRSDIIYIVIDFSQVYMTQSLRDLLEQLKGRDVRFVITKSDMVSQTQCIMLIGQLLWMLSPIMPSDRPPQVHALTTSPLDDYNPFLEAQEQEWLEDLADQISGLSRIESRVAAVRRHAVRVRNHAKLVDCYLATYYKKKGFFTWGTSAKKIALEITENPHQYSIFSGAVVSQLQNISRYDLPDPAVYREFFRVNPLPEFSPLSSTCSFLKGCPIDKLDVAIAYQLPDLVSKYKKLTRLNNNSNNDKPASNVNSKK